MTHEVESMFYTKETPWHGLGKYLDNPATAQEAITMAELDWEVELSPVMVEDKVIEEFNAVRRIKDGRVYCIVRNRYSPIQNKEAFDFFDNVVGSGQAIYHTAGSLKDGARIWILAKLGDSIGIKGEQVDKYICLSNSHDGSMALQMFWTPIRVVCSNTLAMAESARIGQRFYTRHTTRYNDRMIVAQEVLGFANKFYNQWTEQADILANNQLKPAELPLLLNTAFGYEKGIPMEEVYQPVQRDMEVVVRLLETGRGMDNPDIRGTKWAAFNATAEYVDYYRKPRGGKPDNRLNSSWFGAGAKIKERAWNHLLKS